MRRLVLKAGWGFEPRRSWLRRLNRTWASLFNADSVETAEPEDKYHACAPCGAEGQGL